MTTKAMSEVVQHLCRTALRDRAGRTDEQLLEDYLGRRDDTALAALVRRHGPMVWAVCRRILGDEHDAEDAFQATFLVLVRRAGAIQCPRLLANWLYGVAQRTAFKARTGIARRNKRERVTVVLPDRAAVEARESFDLGRLLDEELGRLPDKYRAVVVLCDLEGRTRKETARQLGVPEGTVAGRLARARGLVARRLRRRGVEVPAGLLATVLTSSAARAAVPGPLLAAAVRLVRGFAAARGFEVPVQVALLAAEARTAMMPSMLKVAAAVMLGGAVLVGGWGLGRRAPAPDKADGVSAKESHARANLVVGSDSQSGEKRREQVKPPPAPPDADLSAVQVSSRSMSIPFRIEDNRRAEMNRLHLNVSVDGGRTWKRVASARPTEEAFDFTAPWDGTYWLAVQVERRDGTPEPPLSSLRGELKIAVDTSKQRGQETDQAP